MNHCPWCKTDIHLETLSHHQARCTPTLAPLGAGGEEMKPSEVLLLSSLIRYNAHAWAALIKHTGADITFRRVHELADNKLLIAYRSAAGVHLQCLLDLDTAKVSDES